ncbi:MAG TPA: hypothetical protein VMT89_08015, partial [Candidatus Acidoferrales bacterium]|nr:hypothetical protein [Candidatus Acidoferrales bacterium]
DHGGRWVEIGRRLHDAFAGDDQPSIAVTAAGAIPFYSQLPAVDMLGLCDPDVDQFLVRRRMNVGHERLIPLHLLRQRGVNFLIGHPRLAEQRAIGAQPFTYADFTRPGLFLFPDESDLYGADLIEMPLSSGEELLMVYLTPTPAINARLAQLGWRRYPLR